MIELKNLSFSYENSSEAKGQLRGIDLHVKKGTSRKKFTASVASDTTRRPAELSTIDECPVTRSLAPTRPNDGHP